MNSNQVATISRIVFALTLIVFGFFHFSKGQAMSGGVPYYIPGGVIWIYITGIGLVLAGIAFIINVKVKLAGYLLGLMLIIFILTIHLPKTIETGDSGMLLKDIGLAAASFFIGSKA